MKNKTEKDFEIFKEEVYYWVDYFNLYNWDIRVAFKRDDVVSDLFDEEEKDAWTYADHKNHVAFVYLNKRCVNEKELEKENEIRFVAFHEVCEILLYPLTVLAKETYSENVIVKNTHIIIHHLENSVFKERYGNVKRNVDKT